MAGATGEPALCQHTVVVEIGQGVLDQIRSDDARCTARRGFFHASLSTCSNGDSFESGGGPLATVYLMLAYVASSSLASTALASGVWPRDLQADAYLKGVVRTFELPTEFRLPTVNG